MVKNDRDSNFRAALWTLTTKVIPQASPILQPSLTKIAQLLGNYLLSPEESEKLYHEIREIWLNEPLEIDRRINLLAYCAWKLRLYLTFDETDTAYQLFRKLIQLIRHDDPSIDELEAIGFLDSESFPLPIIPGEDIEFLYIVAEACQQRKGTVTLKRLAEMTKYPIKNVISYLKKLEIVFGCLFASEALGLYDVRVEIDLHSNKQLLPLLEKFKPFAIRCEAHSPKQFSKTVSLSNFTPERLSVEFYYPVNQQDSLFAWAKRNNLKLHIRFEQHIYQNFNVYYRDAWHAKKLTRIKTDAFQTTIENRKERIELSKAHLQIIELYLKQAVFSTGKEQGTIDGLLPFSNLGEHLGLREDWARHTAANLFNQGILVRYSLSLLVGFWPEIILEGNELSLHEKAQQYLYARREKLQLFDDETGSKTRLYRLYVPEISKQIMQQSGFRIIKRLYYAPPPLIQSTSYNFEEFSWNAPHLPEINENF